MNFQFPIPHSLLPITHPPFHRVAIVGAGFSGTCFLSGLIGYLLRDDFQNVEVHIFPDPERFFHVYPIEPLMNIDTIAGKYIGIIGTGLSGIDATLTAFNNGAEKVVLTSKSGRLLSLRGSTRRYYRKFLTRKTIDNLIQAYGYVTLEQVIHLFVLEYITAINTYRLYQQNPNKLKDDEWSCYIGENFYVRDDCPPLYNYIFPEDPIAHLKYSVTEIESCPKNKSLLWRSLILSLYDRKDGLEFGDYVYQRLQIQDKFIFVKEIYGGCNNFTATMSLASAKRLLAFHKQGKFVVLKEFKSITYDNDSDLLKIEANNSKPVYVDIGIDAACYNKIMTLNPLDIKLNSRGNSESSLHMAQQVYNTLSHADVPILL